MDYFFRVAYPWALYSSLPLLILALWYRWYYYKPITIKYSLVNLIKKQTADRSYYFNSLLFFIRFLILCCLAFLMSRPQLVDVRSQAPIDGIDIILALDVSGSMSYADDEHDRRARIDAAKEEAVRFIDQRNHDQIGLVLFGKDCVSRCPLTFDKQIIKSIIKDLQLGIVDPNATMLSNGLGVAINRLKHSKATSKIIILLTDGSPTPGDSDHETAIMLAKKFGIKIYTIGIGGDKPQLFQIGLQIGEIPPVNKKLLHYIASKTGGTFFEAKKPKQLQEIYQTIDALEKTSMETDIYTRYYDTFMKLLIFTFLLACIELILRSFVWFVI